MENPKSDPKLSSASEYALIFGAGASAAVSLAAQQIAAASVPVTALVAIGLMNRHRLDRQVNARKTPSGVSHEQYHQQFEAPQGKVTSQPTPETISAQPNPHIPAMSRPAMGFSSHVRSRQIEQEQHRAAQQASLQAIGAFLQKTRQEQALSLQDIHQRTYIQRYALKAIETGDLATLPEPFYIRAFIRKYAMALGLKGTEIAAQFPDA